MNKHAYLIMAHSRPNQLKKLIGLLDDERNDIYVHIDKNAKMFPVDEFDNICKKSHLTIIERIPVLWGGIFAGSSNILPFKSSKRVWAIQVLSFDVRHGFAY